MNHIEYGIIVGGDFLENEMIIEIDNDDYIISHRKVAIVNIDSISEQIALDEFISTLKNK